MARVLISCSNNRPWSIGQYLEKAARDVGHEVVLFDYRSSDDVHADALALCDEFKPEYHVIYKGESFDIETIRQMRQRGIYTVLWHPDPDIPDWVVDFARGHDLFLTMASGMVEEYRKRGVPCVRWLTEGLEPSAYKFDTITEEERRKYTSDVVLIGNISNTHHYRHRARILQCLLAEGFNVKWWGTHIARKPRNLLLLLSRVNSAWGGSNVWNESYAKVIACTKIFVARDVRPWVDKSMSNRLYYATGLGGFYLTEYTKGIEELYDIGREIEVFCCENELVKKVRYYLEHDDERKAIAAAGQKKTLENYTYQHSFIRMFEMIREIRQVAAQPLDGVSKDI